jgi:hypothetical protein
MRTFPRSARRQGPDRLISSLTTRMSGRYASARRLARRGSRVLAVLLLSFGGVGLAVGASRTTDHGEIRRVAHVVVIVFENHERGAVLGSGLAPTFDHLASRYAQAPDELAVAHPSLPNYLALISGSTHGVTSDCTDCTQRGPTIGSQLTRSHMSWAAYAEGFPASSSFAKKHVPFLYFPGASAHVMSLGRFDPRRLPAYSLVVPNLCHDMHDCSIETGDRWLRTFIRPLLKIKDTVIFIAFDEGTTDQGGGGNVPLVIAGTAVRPHSVFRNTVTHYGLLRTTEALLGLPPLANARTARLLSGIWRQPG